MILLVRQSGSTSSMEDTVMRTLLLILGSLVALVALLKSGEKIHHEGTEFTRSGTKKRKNNRRGDDAKAVFISLLGVSLCDLGAFVVNSTEYKTAAGRKNYHFGDKC